MTILHQVAILDKDAYRKMELCRRIYSTDGFSPTIIADSSTIPKILVSKDSKTN